MTEAVPPPSPDDCERIDPDTWALVLRHVRAALHELDDARVTPQLQRLRASPASRLAGGRMRRALCEVLGQGGPLWRDVRARLEADAVVSAAVPWLLAGEAAPDAAGPRTPRRPPPEAGAASAAAQIRTLKDRARELKEARDAASRRADGAEARAQRAEDRLAAQEEELADLRSRVEDLASQLAAQDDERARAVERERRRNESEVAALEEELRSMRRQEQRRRERRRRERERERAAQAREQERPRPSSSPRPATRAVPGRPSRLPADIARGTTEEARALLEPGRLVIVDGYNVSKQHQPQLELVEQREWLVRWLSGLAARRKVRPTVVFDGAGPRPAVSRDRARGVTVRFSAAGLTADDEIEFAVAALDHGQPVLVVTDDQELSARVRAHGADVVGTRPFLGAGA